MLELIVNVLLLIFFIFTLAFHVLEAPVPEKVLRNPYALQPDAWPRVILYLLVLCVAINIIRLIIKGRAGGTLSLAVFLKSVPGFFKTKMFFGIAIVVAMSFLLEPLGFMLAAFLFMVAYGILLGWRKYWKLALIAAGSTLLLYICFGILLSVNLPRGTIVFLRNFALFLEGIFPSI